MTELTTAFIGLAGVIFGGILQVHAQRRRDREKEIYEIRTKVASLSHVSRRLSSGLRQIAEEVNGLNSLYKKGTPKDSENLLNRKKLLRRITEETDSFNGDISSAVHELDARADQKIGRQARRLANTCTHATNVITPTIRNENTLSGQEARELCDHISYEAHILQKMVAPRRWERTYRFRSRARAEHEVAESDARVARRG